MKLQTHQKKLYDAASTNAMRFPFYLYWSMGSGKSFGALAIVGGLSVLLKRRLRVCILCDKSLVGQWEQSVLQFKKFDVAANFVCSVFNYDKLTPTERNAAPPHPATYDVTLVDEAHLFRAAFQFPQPTREFRWATRHAQWIEEIMTCRHVVYLSGTPLVGNADTDMYSFLSMMRATPVPGRFSFYKTCASRECQPLLHRVSRYSPEDDPKTKKYYPSQRLVEVKCKMLWSQTLLYCAGKQQVFTLHLPGGTSWTLSHASSSAFASFSKSVSNHPFQIRDKPQWKISRPDLSPKFRAIIRNMEEAYDRGERQLVYSRLKDAGLSALIELWSKNARFKTSGNFVIQGDVDLEDRHTRIRAYNGKRAGSDRFIMWVTDAGGRGIDLMRVDVVHLTEPNGNYLEEQQIINRAVRYKSHARDATVTTFLYVSTFPSLSDPLDEMWQTTVKTLLKGLYTSDVEWETIRRALYEQWVSANAETVDEKTVRTRAPEYQRIVEYASYIASQSIV